MDKKKDNKELIDPGWFWCFDCSDDFFDDKYHVTSPACPKCESLSTEPVEGEDVDEDTQDISEEFSYE